MTLIECCGLPGRPCGAVLGYWPSKRKKNMDESPEPHGLSHGYCRLCYLESQLENGVATAEEKKEIHSLFQHHRRAAERGLRAQERRKEDRNDRA